MPGVAEQLASGRPRAEAAEPLSPGERDRALAVAARIHGELRTLVDALPAGARGASGMARKLGIVRNTCQRVVNALQDPEPSLETLAKLPGVKGLDQFLEALGSVGVDGALIELAEVAVRGFESLIDDLAGSHTKLVARLEAVGGAATNEPAGLGSRAARALLYEAAMGVTGRSIDRHISIYAFRRAPGDENTLERALAQAMLGSTVTPGGMPVALYSGTRMEATGEEESSRLLDDSAARGRTPKAFLEAFTSKPMPTITSRGSKGNLVQVVDPGALDGPVAFDVCTAERSSHPFLDPETGEPTLKEVWTLLNAPTRSMILDIYLHESMERAFRPAADALSWNPNLSVPGNDRWIARYPAQPKLELLGRGLERSATPMHPRQTELTALLFAELGWDPGEYVGFRVETEFPIYRAGYCMRFEYRPDV